MSARKRARGQSEEKADRFLKRMDEAFEHHSLEIYPWMNASSHRDFWTAFNLSYIRGLDFSTCAVVGSSSALLKHKQGARIDGHSVVIRANSYPFGAMFAQHVGARTSLTVATYSRFAKPRPATIFYCLVRHRDSCWARSLSDRVPRLSPGLIARTMREYDLSRRPSAGMMSVALARRLCKNLTMFGFGIDASFSNCTHYYNVVSGSSRCEPSRIRHFANSASTYDVYRANRWHDFAAEQRAIARATVGQEGDLGPHRSVQLDPKRK